MDGSITPGSDGSRPPVPHERPRERMFLHGSEALSEVELVAILLGGGRSVGRASRLLETVGGLRGVSLAWPQELCAVTGIGHASATAVCAAVELGRRIARLDLPYSRPLRHPDDVAAYVRAAFGSAPQEVFAVLGLDARQRVRLLHRVGVGSLSHVDVHPREVFRPLLRAGMHSVILIHNHPSGDPEPSRADIELTRRLADAGRLLGVPVLDHLVVTDRQSRSLASLGLLPGT